MKEYKIETALSIKEGFVDITDPCYSTDVWCRLNKVAVVPGEYDVTAYTIKKRDWGTRTTEISIMLSTIKKDEIAHRVSMGSIGVDSGLAGFFIHPKPNYNDEAWIDFVENINDSEVIHSIPEGVFVSSGYGDGAYNVTGYLNRSGKCIGLKIKFM